LGTWLTGLLAPGLLHWVLGLSFLAMAAWMLVPDRLEGCPSDASRLGVFGATLIAFFLAEMGDKTQIATVALAAHYANFTAVVAGTTIGMLLADVPVVLLGGRAAKRIPLRAIRLVAASVFVVLGLLALSHRA